MPELLTFLRRKIVNRWVLHGAVFAALTAGTFLPVLTGRATLIATDFLENSPLWRSGTSAPRNPWLSDTVEYYYPSEKIYSEHVRRGELPLTNPYVFNGAPIPHGVHVWNSIWPVKLAFLTLFDPIRSYDLFAIFHFWLAGVAMFAFLRSLSRSEFASFVAAVAYMFSGRAMLWLHGHYLMATMAYAPLVFLAAQRRSLLGILPAAGLFFTNPQIGLAMSLAVIVYERWSWRVVVPGLLLAGVALVPLGVTVLGMVRDPLGEARYFYGDGFKSWFWLGGLFWPGLGLGSMPPNEYNIYIGHLPLVGAVLALKRERFFAVLAGIGLAVATLYPLPVWIAPVSFSLPTRYLFFFTLGACVCFSRALDRWPLKEWMQLAIILLVLVDLVPRFRAYNLFHDPAILQERPPAVAALKGRTGVVFADRGRAFFPPLSLFGVESVQGYDVGVPRAQADSIAGAGVVSGQRKIVLTDPEDPALEALGMRFLITDGSYTPRRFKRVYSGTVEVYENPSARSVPARWVSKTPLWFGLMATLGGCLLAIGLALLDRFRPQRYS